MSGGDFPYLPGYIFLHFSRWRNRAPPLWMVSQASFSGGRGRDKERGKGRASLLHSWDNERRPYTPHFFPSSPPLLSASPRNLKWVPFPPSPPLSPLLLLLSGEPSGGGRLAQSSRKQRSPAPHSPNSNEYRIRIWMTVCDGVGCVCTIERYFAVERWSNSGSLDAREGGARDSGGGGWKKRGK